MIDYILDLLGYNPNRPTEVLNFRFIVLVVLFVLRYFSQILILNN